MFIPPLLRSSFAYWHLCSPTTATESPINTSTEPPMSPPETFHPWLRLPVELKLEVLACYVPTLTRVVSSSHKKYFQGELGVIVATRNRELVTLCLCIYYSKNAFTATCLRITSHKFHKSPPTTYGHLIRSLYARLIASWDLSITSFTDRPHFGLLFHDQTSTGTNSSLTWQDDFPNLEELELKIVVYLDTELRWADACSSCGITPAQFDGLRKRRSW